MKSSPSEFIAYRERVRAANPLADVMREDGLPLLKDSGKRWKAVCSFHADKNPSLKIYPDHYYKCYGCGAKGDVFTWTMKRHGLTFPEAVERLANRAGISRSARVNDQQQQASKDGTLGEIVARYPYPNPDGTPLFEMVRFRIPGKPKTFRARLLNSDGTPGEWKSVEESKRPLYHADEVARAPRVLIFEGEKDADNVRALYAEEVKAGALACTTNPNGAGKWLAHHSQALAGKGAEICGDNDTSGRAHVRKVVASLMNVAATVRVVKVPAPHKDVSEYLETLPTDQQRHVAIEALLRDATAPDEDGDGVPEEDPNEPTGPDMEPGGAGAWPEPEPLGVASEGLPYPVHELPDGIREAVEEVQRDVKAPAALVGVSALAILSAAAQGLMNVMRGNVSIPVSLFFLSLGESGERKSTLEKLFGEPLERFEAQKRLEAVPILERWEIEKQLWEDEREAVRNAFKKQATKINGGDTTALRERLADLNAREPKKERLPRLLLADNFTSESIEWALFEWPSGAILSSEAGAVFGGHAMKHESIMRTLSLLNKCWDGQPIRVSRRTSESYEVHGPRLTLSLMVQGPVLEDFNERSRGLARGSGFFARFLCAIPLSTMGKRPYRDSSASPNLARFHARITELLNIPVRFDSAGTLSAEALSLAPKAMEEWRVWYNETEHELREGGKYADVRDTAAKAAENVLRLAALFHVFAVGPHGCISFDCVRRACAIVAWHLNEARRLFGAYAQPREVRDASQIEAWLLSQFREATQAPGELPEIFSTRRLQRLGPVRERKRLDKGLEVLEDHNRARKVKDGKRRWVEVNPAILNPTNRDTCDSCDTCSDRWEHSPQPSQLSQVSQGGQDETVEDERREIEPRTDSPEALGAEWQRGERRLWGVENENLPEKFEALASLTEIEQRAALLSASEQRRFWEAAGIVAGQ